MFLLSTSNVSLKQYSTLQKTLMKLYVKAFKSLKKAFLKFLKIYFNVFKPHKRLNFFFKNKLTIT